MRSSSTDPDGYRPEDVVARLIRCLESGIYGYDYTIIARDINEELLEKYVLTENDRLDILKKLTINDYDGWKKSDNPEYRDDIIHFFHHKVALFPRGIEDAETQDVNLYIKLTWTKPGSVLIVISFHE